MCKYVSVDIYFSYFNYNDYKASFNTINTIIIHDNKILILKIN